MAQSHHAPESGTGSALSLAETPLIARASGALWMPRFETLVVSDLHLGKAERNARTGGSFWPPYGNDATLSDLEAELAALSPARLVLLGDSFDDGRCVDHLAEADIARISGLAETCETVWITGNHDPKLGALPGRVCAEITIGPLSLRHISDAKATAEISGHYHPKATIKMPSGVIRRKCFLMDSERLILPAFGAYTGGLDVLDPVFEGVIGADAELILTGAVPLRLPLGSLRRLARAGRPFGTAVGRRRR